MAVSEARELFAAQIDQMCRCVNASLPERQRVLAALRIFARQVTLTADERGPVEEGYIARTIYEDPAGWSLAAVVLRPGQRTPPHDHESWGCAATVQGIERNRRFTGRCPDALTLLDENDAPAGEGYLFEQRDIHQAVGADPERVTISLHFLVRGLHPERQVCRESDQPEP